MGGNVRNWKDAQKMSQQSNLQEPPGNDGDPGMPPLPRLMIRVMARRVLSWPVGERVLTTMM